MEDTLVLLAACSKEFSCFAKSGDRNVPTPHLDLEKMFLNMTKMFYNFKKMFGYFTKMF